MSEEAPIWDYKVDFKVSGSIPSESGGTETPVDYSPFYRDR